MARDRWKKPFLAAAVLITAVALAVSGCGSNLESKAQETKTAEKPQEQALPSSYDAREFGRTSPVKNQGDLGTCWAFASLLALESTLLPEEAWDFSEDHMSHNPNFSLGQEDGGDYIMSMAYLLSWMGPVTEEEDPYGDGISPQGLTAVKHVQEIQLLPARDRERIKQAVYETGGVQSALYTTFSDGAVPSEYYNPGTGAYYCPEDRTPNHDVVIVGWDDGYPGANFPVKAPGDGAFLCENSWGTQFGQDGYFYVSYYDANLGKTSILYSRTEDADHYDRIYQSDLCGWLGQIGYGGDTVWAVNVYQAGEEPERLDAVGFYATAENTDYEVYVLRNVPEKPFSEESNVPLRLRTAQGHVDFAGYYTAPLEERIVLEPGERFGVMMRIRTADVIHPMAIEYDAGDGKCRVNLEDGEGYISPDGVWWERAEETQDCNLCLKAYTTCLGQGKDTE